MGFAGSSLRTLEGRRRLGSGCAERLGSGGVDRGCPSRCRCGVAGLRLPSPVRSVWRLELGGRCDFRQSGCALGRALRFTSVLGVGRGQHMIL